MKLIEAMKLAKELLQKSQDLRTKVSNFCADLDFETAMYPDQKKQIREWMQSHSDILQKIAELRVKIQKTNIATVVTIEIAGKTIPKSIAEWIHRRRELANLDLAMWKSLSDRGLKEAHLPSTAPGGVSIPVKIRRYYDPMERDKMMETYMSEPGIIDRTLEVINATTDLME